MHHVLAVTLRPTQGSISYAPRTSRYPQPYTRQYPLCNMYWPLPSALHKAVSPMHHVLAVTLRPTQGSIFYAPRTARYSPPYTSQYPLCTTHWPLPSAIHKAVSPMHHVLHDASADNKSQNLLKRVRREHATFGMSGQRPVCAALGVTSVR